MTHAIGPNLAAATISAVLYTVLGVWVLTLKPRRLQTTLLGAFAVLFGMTFLPTDLGVMFHVFEPDSLLQNAVQNPVSMLNSVAALALVWAVPEPLEDRRLLGTALAVGFALPIVSWSITFAGPGTYLGVLPVWVQAPLSFVTGGAFVAATVLLALRARPARDPARGDVIQLALLAVALAMLGAFIDGVNIPGLAGNLARGESLAATFDLLDVASTFIVAGLWGWNMVRADDETVAIHRAAMFGILGLLTAGAVFFAAFPGADTGTTVMRGVMRTLGVGLLAYGILRHDLAGLDAKVEWSISKTTVAGVFVAVFFVVSEGAQVLFAGFAQNELLGIVAAGALLFALAPIQKLADRIAETAVPTQGPGSADTAEVRYRTAVEVALADSEITRDEERRLAELADEIDLDATKALEIREEVEETGEGEGP